MTFSRLWTHSKQMTAALFWRPPGVPHLYCAMGERIGLLPRGRGLGRHCAALLSHTLPRIGDLFIELVRVEPLQNPSRPTAKSDNFSPCRNRGPEGRRIMSIIMR